MESKIFAPPQTPIAGAQDGQNLISWRWSLHSPIDPAWWRSMHAISSYPCIRPTMPQTLKQREPITSGMSHTYLCLPSRSWYSFTDPGGMEGW